VVVPGGFLTVAGRVTVYWSTERLREFAPATSRRISIRASVDQYMIDGPTCPECGGHVSTEDGLGYICDDCGREYDNADLFLP
jgi:tRNA(Ile2) C34 agmatinyltransferase TiaS